MVRCFLLVLALSVSVHAQVAGVGYRVAPAASYVLWDNNAGLSDVPLVGANLGVSFGEFVELNGSLLLGRGFATDFGRIEGLQPPLDELIADVASRDVDLTAYGADLKLNLGSGSIIPFLRAGTGLLRFEVEGQQTTENIYLLGGAGVQFSLADRYALSLSVVDLAYRYNLGTTFFTVEDLDDLGLTYDDFAQTQVHNLMLQASLAVYLGGRRPGEMSALDRAFQAQFSNGLRGVSLQVEPFYGQIRFDEVFGYGERQEIAGVRAGLDFGPLVGVRAFYGRATEGSLDFQPMQLYGGNVKFNLTTGDGFVPFVIVGAGYLDLLDGYEAQNPLVADDRPFALGGLGVELPLTPRFRLTGSVQALAMSTQAEGDISQADEVYVNTLLSAGVRFGLGGSTGAPEVVAETELERRLADERAAARSRELDLLTALDQARADGDSAEVAQLQAELLRMERAAADTTRLRMDTTQVGRTASGSNVRGFVNLPIPEEGEIYIRFGEPGGVAIAPVEGASGSGVYGTRADSLRDRLRLSDVGADSLLLERLDEIVDRLNSVETRLQTLETNEPEAAARQRERYEAEIEELQREIQTLEGQRDAASDAAEETRENATPPTNPAAPRTPANQAAPPAETDSVETETLETESSVDRDGTVTTETTVQTVEPADARALRLAPLVGFGFGEGPEEPLVGARVAVRSVGLWGLGAQIDGLVGISDERSLNLHGAVTLPVFSTPTYAPYVGVGAGMISYAEPPADLDGYQFTFDLLAGMEWTTGIGSFVVEAGSGSFGRFNRVLGGYVFRF